MVQQNRISSTQRTSDLNSLNAIHIAGTKGKGSTAAFISSILNEFRQSSDFDAPQKVGLYTSPHLRFVRERIQLNGSPLTEEQFAHYFFETWDRLENAAAAAGQDPKGPTSKPVYFRFLTLMAFHTFKSEGVDAAVIECGIGGAYDSTNIIPSPAVTGITSLGIDHVGVLGSTLPEIAWHKAGIMKPSARCYTASSQDPSAKEALNSVASKVPTLLSYTNLHPDIANATWPLGLQADFQKINASLAVAVTSDYLSQRSIDPSTPVAKSLIASGLASTTWAGRCDTRQEGNITWCIDGGHTLDSITLAGKWFAAQLSTLTSNPKTKIKTYLVFNQQTRERSACSLALALHSTLSSLLSPPDTSPACIPSSTTTTSTTLMTQQPTFSTVLFCTNTTYLTAGTTPDLTAVGANVDDVSALTVQNELAETWRGVDPAACVEVKRTIEEAVGFVRDDAVEDEGTRKAVLVTGSLHLVGGVLEVLESGISAARTQ